MGTLLVAATGGHLKQLYMLRERLDADGCHWVTFDKAQSRSLLGSNDQDVDFVPFIGSRDPGNTLKGFLAARRVFRERRPDAVISTGSAIALPYMVLGRMRGARCIYIESAARSRGPSLTGRMVARIPGVELRTQYPAWADERWAYDGSVFDTFAVRALESPPPIRRVVVTLGTLKYDFSRLVQRVVEVLPENAEVLWQLGGTGADGLPGQTHEWMAESELSAAMRDADVVISHAGVGSALAALECGKSPILIPRRAGFDEHVDDHQEQIAAELARRGLGVAMEADALTLEDLLRASRRVVVPDESRRRPAGRFRREPAPEPQAR